MGIKSTFVLTRETAIQVLVQKAILFTELTDSELENMLECLPGNEFRNFSISTHRPLDWPNFIENPDEF